MHMDTSVTSMREMKAFVHMGEGILKKMVRIVITL